MRSLVILCQEKEVNFDNARSFYNGVTKHSFNEHQENTVFEQLLFGLHQLSGLMALQSISNNADISRIGIVAWYYGIYHACSAMITAQSGTMQETHAGTAKAWDNQLSLRGLVMEPFALRVSSLVKTVYESEIAALKAGNDFVLTTRPTSADDAYGGCCSYLSGTAKWSKWNVEQEILGSKEFKALDVPDFRTKDARLLRDARLTGKTISFLHQAYRYRGKANYREAFFLGYGGARTEKLLSGYADDLGEVLAAFLSMAGAFCSKRLGKDLWASFIEDVEGSRAFSISATEVWK
ncbi:MAG: hypothetical protein EBR02_05260 [Alphaproteobacteria bacterium]|nr:hypothetical protein [Alphaproteobacteria bacterium]